MIDTLLDNLGISEGEDVFSDTNKDVGTDNPTTDSSLSSAESVNSSSLFQQMSLADNSINLDNPLAFSIENPMSEQSTMSLDEQIHGNTNYQHTSNEYASFESTQNEMINPPLSLEGQHNTDFVSSNSSIDIDNLINVPTTDNLEVSDDDINKLQGKVEGVERSEHNGEKISFGSRKCPSRHGCQGATDCDYSYGSYSG